MEEGAEYLQNSMPKKKKTTGIDICIETGVYEIHEREREARAKVVRGFCLSLSCMSQRYIVALKIQICALKRVYEIHEGERERQEPRTTFAVASLSLLMHLCKPELSTARTYACFRLALVTKPFWMCISHQPRTVDSQNLRMSQANTSDKPFWMCISHQSSFCSDQLQMHNICVQFQLLMLHALVSRKT